MFNIKPTIETIEPKPHIINNIVAIYRKAEYLLNAPIL